MFLFQLYEKSDCYGFHLHKIGNSEIAIYCFVAAEISTKVLQTCLWGSHSPFATEMLDFFISHSLAIGLRFKVSDFNNRN